MALARAVRVGTHDLENLKHLIYLRATMLIPKKSFVIVHYFIISLIYIFPFKLYIILNNSNCMRISNVHEERNGLLQKKQEVEQRCQVQTLMSS